MGQLPERLQKAGAFEVHQHEIHIPRGKLHRHGSDPALGHFRFAAAVGSGHQAVGAAFLFMNIKGKDRPARLHSDGDRQGLPAAGIVPVIRKIQLLRTPDAVSFQESNAVRQLSRLAFLRQTDRGQGAGKGLALRRGNLVHLEPALFIRAFPAVQKAFIAAGFQNLRHTAGQVLKTPPQQHTADPEAGIVPQQIVRGRLPLKKAGIRNQKEVMGQLRDSFSPRPLLFCTAAAEQGLQPGKNFSRTVPGAGNHPAGTVPVKGMGQPTHPFPLLLFFLGEKYGQLQVVIAMVGGRLDQQSLGHPQCGAPIPNQAKA